MVVKIPVVFLTYRSSNAVLSLGKFELNENNKLILNKNILDERVNVLQHLFGFIVTAAAAADENRNVTKALCK